jgi:hypothetical protein
MRRWRPDMMRHLTSLLASAAAGLVLLAFAPHALADSKSQVIGTVIRSAQFSQNKIGVSPMRNMLIYLPAGYATSDARYPVIYFLPSPFDSYRAPFEK